MTDLLPTTEPPEAAAPPGDPARPRRTRLVPILAVLAAIVAGVVVATTLGGFLRPHLYAGTVLQGDEPAPSLADLTGVDGRPVDLAAHRGQVVLVFFGYTNCPDICPTTLADVAKAKALLDEGDAERTTLVMVSVDPERDDPASLANYVGFFDPAFTGAAGTPEATARAAMAYGVHYAASEPEANGAYTVDHTGTLLGIGPDGVLRVVWPPGVDRTALAADIEELLS